MSLIGKKVIFFKEYESIPGEGNSVSKEWHAENFMGQILDKHKEYYLIKMDEKSFKTYNETKKPSNNIRLKKGPIFKVYYENIRDLADSDLDKILK